MHDRAHPGAYGASRCRSISTPAGDLPLRPARHGCWSGRAA